MTTQLEDRDYFTDLAVLKDPYEYFEAVRTHGPVYRLKSRDLIFVSGFKESLDVLLNLKDFSSVVSTGGPAGPLPFTPEGEDISPQIETHRDKFMGSNMLVAWDGDKHAASRMLLASLFTPSRLRANEEYMTGLADRMAKEAVAKGKCELMKDIAVSYVTLVIADLLGVPAADREKFMEVIAAGPPAGNMQKPDPNAGPGPLEFMAGYFARYIQDRRANPRADVLTELANAKLPDGTTPELSEVVMLAMFLFAAGQDTSAKLLGNAVRYLAETPDMQQHLRENRKDVAGFVEEMLRLEGSTKATFRIARRKVRVGDVELQPGDRLIVGLAAANRDPRRWDNPAEFRLNREKIKENIAFGRGAHTCIGAPLARVEVRVLLEKLLDHTSKIELSEEHHGPAGNRKLKYEPSYIIRGLEDLHVVLRAK